jgi:hypothetical protein
MIKKFNLEYILLSVVLILGFLVRLYKINNPVGDWHSWRQADTASVSRIYLQKGINLLYPRYHDISSIQTGIFNPNGYRFVEFPIYNAINVLLYKAYSKITLEVWARLLTITSAVVTAFFLFFIGRKFLGKWGGVLSAFFYLFIPFNIYFTRVILPDPIGVTFGVISIWAFIKFLETDSDIPFYFSAFFFALALLIKPYLGFYLVPIGYLAFRKISLKKAITFLTIAFLPFLAWRVWEGRHPEGIPFYTWAFDGDGIRFRPAFWYWIFGERLGHLILGMWGLIPFAFGILRPKLKNYFINYFLIGCLIYVTVIATANVRHDYYQILTIPAISLALASGFIFLWSSVSNKITSRVIAVFSVSMMLMLGWMQIKDDYQVNHPEIIEAGQEVNKITPKDALIVAPYDGDTAFLYQTQRSGWPAIDTTIDKIISQGASYYVSVNLTDSDTKMIEARFKTMEKTNKFIIINLHAPLKTK